MVENPYRLLTREGWSHGVSFGTRGVLSSEFVEYCLKRIPLDACDACLVDHPVFGQIRNLADRGGIPTLIASHNIESLDAARLNLESAFEMQRAAVDFANELRSLGTYAERFAISRIEASLITGVGLSCQLYPYVPRGSVRKNLQRIAADRLRSRPNRNLFLLMGTATHAPTRRSIEWFLRHAARDGLPSTACVALVGSKVHELLPEGKPIRGLDVRGRVSDEELEDLLRQANCALVPQRMGFGALTRLPEFACAGVPSLAFPHAGFAIEPPPGLTVLANDSWDGLLQGMHTAMESNASIAPESYAAWEEHQPRPVGWALRRAVPA
jgi:hypothetical protein